LSRSLAGIFFLSGSAALLFESLWFRQTLLGFGSSVVASTLVLSSFMTGLALGNAAAARFGTRVRRPVRVYAILEIFVGLLGFALVWGLPKLGPLLAPLLGPMLDGSVTLQFLRFVVAFACLVGPAAAMGATLPLLVRALSRHPDDFGKTLGALYGWNTLGAVVGALIGEGFLIERVGVTNTSLIAAAMNGLAALGAFAIARRSPERVESEPGMSDSGRAIAGLSARAWRILAAAFVAGALLLALQVAWFRVLLLFVAGTGRAFAVMLAVVLSGIAIGSLAASAWMKRDLSADRHAWAVALFAGAVGMVGFGQLGIALFDPALPRVVVLSASGISLTLILMFPTSLASGLLFALLGKSLNDELAVPVRSAGLLTLVNTIGAAVGPVIAGFLFLPLIGSEQTLLLLCGSYLLVSALSIQWAKVRKTWWNAIVALLFVVVLATFPSGRLQDEYVPFVLGSQLLGPSKIIAHREGLTETIHITETSFLDEPVSRMLVTDGYAMSNSGTNARRYMNLFVQLPAAFHPQIQDALLISYGVGNTARTLTRTPGIRSIDIVDISRDILDMSGFFFPDPRENPLHDTRVRIHIEDGRYFLQTTDRSFDLITGEPPPPNIGNVTYLYTREYFQLAYDRLREGGILSYWLPVEQLQGSEVGSITRSFCGVFENCTLWNGGNLNWILLGSRGALAQASTDALTRSFQDPRSRADFFDIGVESPAALGALFLADPEQLAEISDFHPPVLDDFPLRIHNWLSPPDVSKYIEISDPDAARGRFARSKWIRRVWPSELNRQTHAQFRYTRIVEQAAGHLATTDPATRLALLRDVLEATDLVVLPQRLLYGDPRALAIAERKRNASEITSAHAFVLGQGALARRDFAQAAAYFEATATEDENELHPLNLAAYAHCRAGATDALKIVRARLAASGAPPAIDVLGRGFRRDLKRNPGIDDCWAAAWDPDRE